MAETLGGASPTGGRFHLEVEGDDDMSLSAISGGGHSLFGEWQEEEEHNSGKKREKERETQGESVVLAIVLADAVAVAFALVVPVSAARWNLKVQKQ